MDKPSYFFPATQSVDHHLGHSFSFLWATYAGLRELWWQVRGFHQTFPRIHINQIRSKFLSGLPLPGGIDLEQICISTNWDQHEGEFAKLLLFEACTLYEGWLEKVCRDIFPSSSWERYAKKLQFPRSINSNSQSDGYVVAIAAANVTPSRMIATEFFPNLRKKRSNCWGQIDDYLSCYRYFKECRNAYIHSDGIATAEVIDWYRKLASIQKAASPSPVRDAVRLPAPTLGLPIPLDLRDCTLFAAAVRRMIGTLDAALCVAAKSEDILAARIRHVIASHRKWTNWPHDTAAQLRRLHRLLYGARVPEPVNIANVLTWMKSRGLV